MKIPQQLATARIVILLAMSVLRAVAPILDNMTDDERRATMLVLGGGGALAALGIAGTLVDAHARRSLLNRNDMVPVDLTNFRCDGRVSLKYVCRHDHYSRRKLVHDSKLHVSIFPKCLGRPERGTSLPCSCY